MRDSLGSARFIRRGFASIFSLPTHSILCNLFPSSLKKEDLEFWPNEEDDPDDKKETGYGSTIGCLGLQSNDDSPKTDLKTKLLGFKKDPVLEGECKNDNQKDQKDNVWKHKGMNIFRAVPRFKRPSFLRYQRTPGSSPSMALPPEQSAPSSPYSDTGMDTKHKSLMPMTSETKNTLF